MPAFPSSCVTKPTRSPSRHAQQQRPAAALPRRRAHDAAQRVPAAWRIPPPQPTGLPSAGPRPAVSPLACHFGRPPVRLSHGLHGLRGGMVAAAACIPARQAPLPPAHHSAPHRPNTSHKPSASQGITIRPLSARAASGAGSAARAHRTPPQADRYVGTCPQVSSRYRPSAPSLPAALWPPSYVLRGRAVPPAASWAHRRAE